MPALVSAGTAAVPPVNASHPAFDRCPPPPTETCCLHQLRAPNTSVRVRFSSPVILTSVTVWDNTPKPSPPRQASALANVSIRVGRDTTATICSIMDPSPLSSDPSTDPAWMPGFTRKALLCGTSATYATVHIPRDASAAAGGGGQQAAAFAVKVCVARLDAAAALRDVALWLQEAPP